MRRRKLSAAPQRILLKKKNKKIKNKRVIRVLFIIVISYYIQPDLYARAVGVGENSDKKKKERANVSGNITQKRARHKDNKNIIINTKMIFNKNSSKRREGEKVRADSLRREATKFERRMGRS